MKFSFRIALRYLFSKSSKTVVNRINLFALVVLIISSGSLLIVLSGFEGLKNFGMSFYNQFEPDYKVVPKIGKTLKLNEEKWNKLNNSKEIIFASRVIEEKMFLSFEGKNQAAYVKGNPSAKQIINKSKSWKPLLNKSKLYAHKKHNFLNKLMKTNKVNYLRINIFPDGGISRIRVFGKTQ